MFELELRVLGDNTGLLNDFVLCEWAGSNPGPHILNLWSCAKSKCWCGAAHKISVSMEEFNVVRQTPVTILYCALQVDRHSEG